RLTDGTKTIGCLAFLNRYCGSLCRLSSGGSGAIRAAGFICQPTGGRPGVFSKGSADQSQPYLLCWIVSGRNLDVHRTVPIPSRQIAGGSPISRKSPIGGSRRLSRENLPGIDSAP